MNPRNREIIIIESNATQLTQEFSYQIGEKVKSEREKNGWSLTELAQKCNLSIVEIMAIEKGTQNMTINTIAKLQIGLGQVFALFGNFRKQ